MTIATQTSFGKLLAFLDQLDEHTLPYTLAHVRDTIMVRIVVPGQRWEIEFYEDGEVEIERFISTGVDGITDDALTQLIEQYKD